VIAENVEYYDEKSRKNEFIMSEKKRIMAKNEGKLSTSQMDWIKPKKPFHAIVPWL
jgi:hypothetical protein